MPTRPPFAFCLPEPAALLREADGWAAGLEDPAGAYRAVTGFAGALAAISETAEPREWARFRSALLSHPMTQVLRRDPLVAHAWRSSGPPAEIDAMLDDLMLRHPDRDPLVRRADAIGQNVHAVTTSLPIPDSVRERRRVLFRLADAVAEQRQQAEILAVNPGLMREAGSSVSGPAGRIRRWVALLPSSVQAQEVFQAMPLPWVVPCVGNTLTMLQREDLLGRFDLVYANALERLTDASAEALAVAAFSRLKPGGRLFLACLSPGASDCAFWCLSGRRTLHRRDEAAMARISAALPPNEVAGRHIFANMGDTLVYLDVLKH